VERVRGEHPWPEDYDVKGGGCEQALNLGVETAQGIRLLEERVRRLVWRREVDDAPALPRRGRREARDDRRGGGRRRSPDEEYCPNSLEGRVERRGRREVADHDLGAGRECRLFRPARERAHGHVATQKLIDDETPDAARCTCY
jgi:hypothetical protein